MLPTTPQSHYLLTNMKIGDRSLPQNTGTRFKQELNEIQRHLTKITNTAAFKTFLRTHGASPGEITSSFDREGVFFTLPHDRNSYSLIGIADDISKPGEKASIAHHSREIDRIAKSILTQPNTSTRSLLPSPSPVASAPRYPLTSITSAHSSTPPPLVSQATDCTRCAAEVDALKEQILKIRADRNVVLAEDNKLRRGLRSLWHLSETKCNYINRLTTQLNKTTDRLKENNEQIETLTLELSSKSDELENLKERNLALVSSINTIETLMKEIRSQSRNIMHELSEAHNDVATLRTTLGEATARIAQLEGEMAALNEQARAVPELNSALAAASREIQELKSQIDAARNENTVLRGQLGDAEIEKNELQVSLEEQRGKTVEAEAGIAQILARLEMDPHTSLSHILQHIEETKAHQDALNLAKSQFREQINQAMAALHLPFGSSPSQSQLEALIRGLEESDIPAMRDLAVGIRLTHDKITSLERANKTLAEENLKLSRTLQTSRATASEALTSLGRTTPLDDLPEVIRTLGEVANYYKGETARLETELGIAKTRSQSEELRLKSSLTIAEAAATLTAEELETARLYAYTQETALEDLTKRFAALTANLNESERRRVDISDKYDSEMRQIVEKLGFDTDTRPTLQEIKEAIDKKNSELEHSLLRIAALENAQEGYEATISENSATISRLENELAEKAELLTTAAELGLQTSEIQESLQAANERLLKELENEKALRTALSLDNAKLNETITALKSETTALSRAKETLQANLDAKTVEVSTLAAGLEESQKRADVLTHEKESLQSELTTTKEALAASQKEVLRVTALLTERDTKLIGLTTDLKAAKAERDQSKAEVQRLTAELNSQKSIYQSQYDEYQRAKAENDVETAHLKEELNKAAETIRSNVYALNEAKAADQTHKAEVATLTKELANTKATLAAAHTHIASLTTQLNKARSEVETSRATLTSLVTKTRSDYADLEKQVTDLLAKQESANALQAELDSALATIAAQAAEIRELKAERVQLEGTISKRDATIVELRKRILELEAIPHWEDLGIVEVAARAPATLTDDPETNEILELTNHVIANYKAAMDELKELSTPTFKIPAGEEQKLLINYWLITNQIRITHSDAEGSTTFIIPEYITKKIGLKNTTGKKEVRIIIGGPGGQNPVQRRAGGVHDRSFYELLYHQYFVKMHDKLAKCQDSDSSAASRKPKEVASLFAFKEHCEELKILIGDITHPIEKIRALEEQRVRLMDQIALAEAKKSTMRVPVDTTAEREEIHNIQKRLIRIQQPSSILVEFLRSRTDLCRMLVTYRTLFGLTPEERPHGLRGTGGTVIEGSPVDLMPETVRAREIRRAMSAMISTILEDVAPADAKPPAKTGFSARSFVPLAGAGDPASRARR